MSRSSVVFSILVLYGLLSGTAWAAQPPGDVQADKQWYVGAGLGRSHVAPDTDGTGYSLQDKHDTGYKFFLGRDLSRRLGLEAYLSKPGKAGLSPTGEVEYKDYGLSALYYFLASRHLHKGWGLFGRVGVGRMDNDADIPVSTDNGSHLMLGAGLEYGFSNGLALRADADFYDKDSRLFAINLLKRFGGRKKAAARPVAPADSDGDGVGDSDDQCPATPAGAAVDARGCEPDGDGDGVPDARDRCPQTPAGNAVDARGCVPVRDADGDGVPDDDDACPHTPTGAAVDARGCEPDSDGDGIVDSRDRCPNTAAGAPVDARGCKLLATIVLKGVTFATASAELVGDSRKVLDEVAETLQRNPGLRLEIAGYTDNRGSRKYNLALSRKRAKAVMDYLVGRGIDAVRLRAKGYGPDDPIADNATAEGRAANRRVELHILD
ncbi:MAG TPA: OmpA family protein [Anaerolineae bacterium]|nr:OmpA family protein [Anaerolineae bacterium]